MPIEMARPWFSTGVNSSDNKTLIATPAPSKDWRVREYLLVNVFVLAPPSGSDTTI
jgi:hypothetical protein